MGAVCRRAVRRQCSPGMEAHPRFSPGVEVPLHFPLHSVANHFSREPLEAASLLGKVMLG